MNAIDIIPLPRLTALGALALAEQFLSAAAPHKKNFPAVASGARAALGDARATMSVVLRDKVEPSSITSELPELDRGLDSAYAGLSSFVDAFVRLPGDDERNEQARAVQKAIFPEGLKFTQLPYALEWAESQVRIDRMATPEIAGALKGLGAKAFVDSIGAAHEAYGRALGMGAAKSSAPAPLVRPAYDALLTAMRWYILKVAASAEPDDLKKQALVDSLLLPLKTWSAGSKRRKKGDVDPLSEETDAPASTPATEPSATPA